MGMRFVTVTSIIACITLLLAGCGKPASNAGTDQDQKRIADEQAAAELSAQHEQDAAIDEQKRLLALKAAWMIDQLGAKGAKSEISQIKVVVPNIALAIIDQAIQMHGAAGVSEDFPLAEMFASIRTLRIADGPDEVHRALIAKLELSKYKAGKSEAVK